MTEKQRNFVAGLTNGLTATAAARKAGYSEPRVDGARARRSKQVQEEMRAQVALRIDTHAPEMLTIMLSLARHSESPKVQFDAARWVLEASGHGLAAQAVKAGVVDHNKPLHQMTLGELQALIEQSRQAVSQLVDVTPVATTGEVNYVDTQPVNQSEAVESQKGELVE